MIIVHLLIGTKLNYFKIMGFLSKLVQSTVKVALTPVAVVKDTVDVVTGTEPKNTQKLLESAVKDVEKATDDLADGELL